MRAILIKLYNIKFNKKEDAEEILKKPVFVNYKLAKVISYYPIDIDGKTYNYYSIIFDNRINSGISKQLDELLDIDNAQFK